VVQGRAPGTGRPRPSGESAEAVVDVMITVFCYLCQFSAKKLAFFSKPMYDHIFAKTSSSLSKKRHYFRQIFRQKYI
jgi:hypothetical protein